MPRKTDFSSLPNEIQQKVLLLVICDEPLEAYRIRNCQNAAILTASTILLTNKTRKPCSNVLKAVANAPKRCVQHNLCAIITSAIRNIALSAREQLTKFEAVNDEVTAILLDGNFSGTLADIGQSKGIATHVRPLSELSHPTVWCTILNGKVCYIPDRDFSRIEYVLQSLFISGCELFSTYHRLNAARNLMFRSLGPDIYQKPFIKALQKAEMQDRRQFGIGHNDFRTLFNLLVDAE